MKIAVSITVLALASGAGAAAQKTWTGHISDEMCGNGHLPGEHGKKMSDRECTVACVKDGWEYVFVADGKVLKIANQDFAALRDHAGGQVRLTGQLKNDAVTVTKIEPVAQGKPKR